MGCSGCAGKRVSGRSYNVSGMTRAQRALKLKENLERKELKDYNIKISANATKKSKGVRG